MKHMLWNGAILAVSLAVAAAPARAQNEADEPDEATEVVIEVDEDGRILVNGEPMAAGEGRVVIRLDGDGEVAIDRDERRTRIVRSGRAQPFAWRGDVDFDPPRPLRVPAIEPLVERFRMQFDGFGELFEEHREVASLERESREMAARARRATGDERAELEGELREKLNEIFERKMEVRRERIADIEERLAEERSRLQERSEARGEIIDRRFQELLGESDPFEW